MFGFNLSIITFKSNTFGTLNVEHLQAQRKTFMVSFGLVAGRCYFLLMGLGVTLLDLSQRKHESMSTSPGNYCRERSPKNSISVPKRFI
jgi:hypothetical protein